MEGKTRQPEKFMTIEEYEKAFYPSEHEKLEPKSASARHFGVCLARELLAKYKESDKAKASRTITS